MPPKEGLMSGRIGVVGVLSILACGIGPLPLFAAETAIPTEQDITTALHSVPKGLGVHQGLPVPGRLPEATASPYVRNVSLRGDGGSPAPTRRNNAEPAGGVPPVQASTVPHPAYTFNTIQFRFGSAQLAPESSETLRVLGNALNHALKDQNSFVIEGHTDKAGTRAYNEELSQRRADAVKDYLVKEMAVSADRLQAVGKGFSEPVDPRRPYGAENRRVVVVNTEG
jgi:outer membrane protein OmpA-like peptidoglycan-associated protein